MKIADFTFERLDAIERARTPSALIFEVHRVATEFGLNCFHMGEIPEPNKDFEPCTLLHNWPPGWFRRYMDNAYVDIDPVLRKLRSAVDPFAWNDAAYDPRKDMLAHKVMCEAPEFGLKVGYTVPLCSPSGAKAGMTFGGERFDDIPGAKRALHFVAVYAHSKVRNLTSGRRKPEVPQPKLSTKEIEVLKWCAAGKSYSRIADILLVSTTTIETHIGRACRKLAAANRTQAVVEAMRARLIF
jgi:LuxR family transcriptional regulator, quorum-sensing system regulator BjaR1